ncbi:MAG: DUF1841 family protein [Deltaproteobacteria bacterium]|nr:DUF1841 family protein [Deltaproteobacteria bacterium]
MTESIDQDTIAAEIMAEHKRVPHADVAGPELHLHVTLHTVVETQLRSGEPAETQKTLDRLMREGLDRHRAIHAMCSVASAEFMRVMRDKQIFDGQRYAAALEALKVDDWLE